jgi:hypothetical protein
MTQSAGTKVALGQMHTARLQLRAQALPTLAVNEPEANSIYPEYR